MKGTKVSRTEGKCRELERLKQGGAGKSEGEAMGVEHSSQWSSFNQDPRGSFLLRLSFPFQGKRPLATAREI